MRLNGGVAGETPETWSRGRGFDCCVIEKAATAAASKTNREHNCAANFCGDNPDA